MAFCAPGVRFSAFHRIAVGASSCAALIACHSSPAAPAVAPVPVTVHAVVERSVPVTAQYVAQTKAVQQVDLVPRVDGYLQTVSFRNGSIVHRGQVLMQIQPEQYEAAVMAAQASVDKANADLIRARSNVADEGAKAAVAADAAAFFRAQKQLEIVKPLAAKQAVPQTDLYNAQTQYATSAAALYGAKANLEDVELNQRTAILNALSQIEQAKAQLINAQLDLSYTTITSPVTGIISFLKVDQGNFVSPAKTQSLATVSTIDPMNVEFQLSETDYLKIAPRLLEMSRHPLDPILQLYLSDGSRYRYAGTPQHLNRAVDAQTGTISVEGSFPNPEGLLRPGQFARVEFPIATRAHALLVPQSAIVALQGATVVYVLGPNDKVLLRSVEVGSSYGADAIIDNGLAAGETVIVGGANRLTPGMTVAPTAAPRPK